MRMPSILESAPESEALPVAEVVERPAAATSFPSGRPRLIPTLYFGGIHLACLAILWVGFSWTALWVCLAHYALRMFAITAGYHRLFAHRSYTTSRVFRFFLAVLGTLALQKGPLWWASVHRQHHRASDTPEDVHSPVQRGFWWAHVGWILGADHSGTDYERIKDFAKYPELRWLDRLHFIAPFLLGWGLYALGAHWAVTRPELGTNGPQMLVWGVAVSTVLLYHGTWSVNSILHLWGRRRYKTRDASRNNLWVALYTFGEGWHNNHHRFQSSEKQGFFWWQIDVSHMVLWLFSRVGLVWDLKRPPRSILEEGRYNL